MTAITRKIGGPPPDDVSPATGPALGLGLPPTIPMLGTSLLAEGSPEVPGDPPPEVLADAPPGGVAVG
jgi:hypothetical protein